MTYFVDSETKSVKLKKNTKRPNLFEEAGNQNETSADYLAVCNACITHNSLRNGYRK